MGRKEWGTHSVMGDEQSAQARAPAVHDRTKIKETLFSRLPGYFVWWLFTS